MARQVFTHRWQALAQVWQQGMSPHSRQALAQASQASAQRPHIFGERDDSYCIRATHVLQVSIQVRQSLSHIAQSQPVTHSRQACKQVLHASMQAAFFAGSIAVSAAGAELAERAKPRAIAGTKSVNARNMEISFGVEAPTANQVRQVPEKNLLVTSRDATNHEPVSRVIQFLQTPYRIRKGRSKKPTAASGMTTFVQG